VAATVVVILAAGQGTRMRSDLQKLLHPLCGRPIIEWPIAAALEAGAGKVVVVDSPERRLEAALPEGVVLPGRGPGDRRRGHRHRHQRRRAPHPAGVAAGARSEP
jgi:NDP-sugar pyrophosphorylase family protein